MGGHAHSLGRGLRRKGVAADAGTRLGPAASSPRSGAQRGRDPHVGVLPDQTIAREITTRCIGACRQITGAPGGSRSRAPSRSFDHGFTAGAVLADDRLQPSSRACAKGVRPDRGTARPECPRRAGMKLSCHRNRHHRQFHGFFRIASVSPGKPTMRSDVATTARASRRRRTIDLTEVV